MCGGCGYILAFYWTSLGTDTWVRNAALLCGWVKSLNKTSPVLDFLMPGEGGAGNVDDPRSALWSLLSQ